MSEKEKVEEEKKDAPKKKSPMSVPDDCVSTVKLPISRR